MMKFSTSPLGLLYSIFIVLINIVWLRFLLRKVNIICSCGASFVFGFILALPSFLYGLNISYPTVALSQMQLDLNYASWFGSVAIFTSPASSIIVGIIIDNFGRKTAILYSILPSIAGWSLQYYFSTSMAAILTGQALNGLTIGAVSYPVQVYAGECIMMGSIRLRNSFMLSIAVGASLATTLMLLMGNFLAYQNICAICTAYSILLVSVILIVIPESPTWLYHRGRIGDAQRSRRKLGIAQPILDKCAAGSTYFAQPHQGLRWSTIMAHLRKITRRDVYLPAILVSTGALLYQLSGGFSAITYMINIIDDTIPGSVQSAHHLPTADRSQSTTAVHISDANTYSLISGIAMVVGSLMSSVVIPRLGVKCAFIFSNIGNVVGLTALTCSATVVQSGQTALVIRVAALALLSFLVSVTLGPSLAAAGDVFPVDAKGFASIPDVVGFLAAGLSNKIFPYLYFVMAGYTYLVFATISIVCSIYVYLFMPEVIGKTLQQIHNEFT